MSDKVIAVLGVGPGLGLSMARRFGREGFRVALVSRTDRRHAGYAESLAADGIESRGWTADLTDPAQSRDVLARIAGEMGPIDTVYFGPADPAMGAGVMPITEAGPDTVRAAVDTALLPAVAVAHAALPAMLDRGTGALLFAGGASGKHPMPMLGGLVPAAAALRMYVLTLHEALRERGVYAATLTIGGLIERGDIHRDVIGGALEFEGPMIATLNPDDIADSAWRMYAGRIEPEGEFIGTAPGS